MTEHVTKLFSERFDDRLSAADREKVDAHLSQCANCQSEWGKFQSVVQAVREMPKARMAQPVHLPSTAPAAESTGFLAGISAWMSRRTRPLVAVGTTAVVALMLAVGVGNLRPAGTATAPLAPGSSSQQRPALQAPADGAAYGTQCTPVPLQVSATSQASGSFNNSTSATENGLSLFLATDSGPYYPGQTVNIWSRADFSGGQVKLPCVVLSPEVSISQLNTPAAAGAGDVAVPQNSNYGSFEAAQSGEYAPDGGPLQSVQIPANATPGTPFQLTATIVAPDGRQFTVTLTLRVSAASPSP